MLNSLLIHFRHYRGTFAVNEGLYSRNLCIITGTQINTVRLQSTVAMETRLKPSSGFITRMLYISAANTKSLEKERRLTSYLCSAVSSCFIESTSEFVSRLVHLYAPRCRFYLDALSKTRLCLPPWLVSDFYA